MSTVEERFWLVVPRFQGKTDVIREVGRDLTRSSLLAASWPRCWSV